MKPLPFLAALSLAACATVPDAPIVDGGPIRTDGLAAIDQPTRVGPLVVTPKAVVEDSRCPVDVQCVWAGRLVVRTRIDGAGWRETSDLVMGQPYTTHGTTLELVAATPEKRASQDIAVSDYLFRFELR